MRTFSDPRRLHGNVLLNWRSPAVKDILAVAAGYKNAAHELVASLERAIVYADHRGYPILFMYRHAVELYLKALVYRAAQLRVLETELGIVVPRLWKEHSLRRLVDMAKPILAKLDLNDAGVYRDIPDEVEEVICDIDRLDPVSCAFRYPVTSAGGSTLPSHLIVNVIVFAENVQPALDWLLGACIRLEEVHQSKGEARSWSAETHVS